MGKHADRQLIVDEYRSMPVRADRQFPKLPIRAYRHLTADPHVYPRRQAVFMLRIERGN